MAIIDNRTAIAQLLADIEYQYRRRVGMYREAGGDTPLRGSLTAYLDYAQLQAAFPAVESQPSPQSPPSNRSQPERS